MSLCELPHDLVEIWVRSGWTRARHTETQRIHGLYKILGVEPCAAAVNLLCAVHGLTFSRPNEDAFDLEVISADYDQTDLNDLESLLQMKLCPICIDRRAYSLTSLNEASHFITTNRLMHKYIVHDSFINYCFGRVSDPREQSQVILLPPHCREV